MVTLIKHNNRVFTAFLQGIIGLKISRFDSRQLHSMFKSPVRLDRAFLCHAREVDGPMTFAHRAAGHGTSWPVNHHQPPTKVMYSAID